MDFEFELRKIESYLRFLEKLSQLLRSETDLLKEFSISEKDLERLDELQDKLQDYRTKLEKRIVEVAFVGVEKSGKSTLINAIIQNDFLPAERERTTYTVTTVKYGESEKIKISFHRESEFLDVFRQLLKDIRYPGYESMNLEVLTKEKLKDHFKRLEIEDKELYENHKATTMQDLEEIIEGKEIILELLRRYGGRSIETTEEFRRYKEFITDRYKSRTVRELEIYTPLLRELNNIVIYDLPGFDSPTAIHKKFTIEKIKRADAVVFVREAERPSLRQLEVQVIIKTREEDGVPLSKKLFFFLNQADKLRDTRDLEDVKIKFFNELKHNEIDIDRNKRVIFGSALGRLQKLNMIEGTFALEGLKRLNIDDGIDELMERIKEFYENDRIKLLQQRLYSVYDRVNEFVEKIKDTISSLTHDSLSQEFEIELEIERAKVKERILERIEEYQGNLKAEMKKRSITESLKENIRNEFVFEKLVTENTIERTKRSVEAESSTEEERPTKFNYKLREELYRRVNEKFESMIKGNIELNLNRIKEDILSIFIEELKCSASRSERAKELIDSEYLLNSLGIDFAYEKFGISVLVERFAGDILQLLLNNPLDSVDRTVKLKEIEGEIYSLLAYSDEFNPEMPLSEHPLIYQIKFHRNVESNSELRKKFEELISKCGLKLDSDILKILYLLIRATNAGAILTALEELINKEQFQKINANFLRNFIENRIESNEVIKRPESYQDVINEIKRDVQLSADILTTYVLRAIGPERALINRITRYIQILKDDLRKEAGEFNRFFRRRLGELKPEFENEKAIRYEKLKRVEHLREYIENIAKIEREYRREV